MSLKTFHILFIVASTLLTTGFGVWAIKESQAVGGTTGELAMGITSLVLTIALLVYGRYFLRKLRHISYL